ncbi:MAG: glycosyltransferase family 2 protein [Flavobacteriaceae bacterium]
MKPIVIVILNHNGLKLLKKFLSNVILYSPEADVVIIDNGSSDNSVSWLKNNYSDLKRIELKKNYGYAEGYNRGLKGLNYEYYALLNNDLSVTKGWLTPLIEEFKAKNKVAIIQPHILNFENKKYFDYAGAAGGFLDKYGYPFCRGRILNTVEKDNGQYNKTSEIFWASGACFLIRKNVFWELDGFDIDFFAHQEEIDLCWRVLNQGYKVLAVGSSKVYHIGGGTLPPSPKKIYLNHRNSLFMLNKNLPINKRINIIITRLFLDGFIGIYYVLTLQLSKTLAIIKAHYSFYKNSKNIIYKRKKSVLNIKYHHRKSIIFDYFISRKLYFSDLSKKIE